MAGKAKSASGVQTSRPADVRALLTDGPRDDPSWITANLRHNRFFVVNLDRVMGALGVEYTRTAPFFHDATAVILKETDWKRQCAFEYDSSHTQLRPEARHKPKQFGRAAAIIVAMELLAREKRPDMDVYELLRILPAASFVDRFDNRALAALRDADSDFEQKALTAIDQPYGRDLLTELAEGHCVTRHTAGKLVEFINENYPPALHVGPVRDAGEDSFSYNLGRKNTAPSLRVPRTLAADQLSPLTSTDRAKSTEC